MGITNEIAPKLVDAEVVGVAIAKGDAEIGIQQIRVDGGARRRHRRPLPGAFQVITTFSAGLDAKAKEKAAEAFIKFLAGGRRRGLQSGPRSGV
jgi:hypothetical protein